MVRERIGQRIFEDIIFKSISQADERYSPTDLGSFLNLKQHKYEKKKPHIQMHHSKIVENYRQREKPQTELGKSAHYL